MSMLYGVDVDYDELVQKVAEQYPRRMPVVIGVTKMLQNVSLAILIFNIHPLEHRPRSMTGLIIVFICMNIFLAFSKLVLKFALYVAFPLVVR